MYARDQGELATPIGWITVTAVGNVLTRISIGERASARGDSQLVQAAIDQLAAWFAGDRHDFALPLAAPASPRGAALRTGLLAVAYGDTLSYGALARRLGSSPRAIGQLCARNPFPIIVPCHRVLTADGALGHYSAGAGPETKAWLIAHEGRVSGNTDKLLI